MTAIMQSALTNNISYSFITSGAMLYLDAGQSSSYSGSGTTWTDLSTNTNNATLGGSPTFTSAGNASYFTFNGAGNQYASTPTAKYNQTYTGKTVFIAARMTSIASSQFRCLFGTASGSRNFNTYIYNNGSAYVIHYSAGGLGGFSNSLPLTTNQWFIIAVTQTTGGLVTYYFNGQPAGTNSGITFSQWVSNGGENVAYGDNYWYGDIPVCAIYNRALSSGEITQNFNTLRGRYGI